MKVEDGRRRSDLISFCSSVELKYSKTILYHVLLQISSGHIHTICIWLCKCYSYSLTASPHDDTERIEHYLDQVTLYVPFSCTNHDHDLRNNM